MILSEFEKVHMDSIEFAQKQVCMWFNYIFLPRNVNPDEIRVYESTPEGVMQSKINERA